MKNNRNYRRRRARLRRLIDYHCFELGFECELCGAPLYDFPKYDTRGCIRCDRWVTDYFDDIPDSERPARPLGVGFDNGEISRHTRRTKGNLRDKYALRQRGKRRKAFKRLLYNEIECDKLDRIR